MKKNLLFLMFILAVSIVYCHGSKEILVEETIPIKESDMEEVKFEINKNKIGYHHIKIKFNIVDINVLRDADNRIFNFTILLENGEEKKIVNHEIVMSKGEYGETFVLYKIPQDFSNTNKPIQITLKNMSFSKYFTKYHQLMEIEVARSDSWFWD